MAYKIKKPKERKTRVGDIIVRNNYMYKVVSIKEDKEGRILELKPY